MKYLKIVLFSLCLLLISNIMASETQPSQLSIAALTKNVANAKLAWQALQNIANNHKPVQKINRRTQTREQNVKDYQAAEGVWARDAAAAHAYRIYFNERLALQVMKGLPSP